jgi:hypothetical protein
MLLLRPIGRKMFGSTPTGRSCLSSPATRNALKVRQVLHEVPHGPDILIRSILTPDTSVRCLLVQLPLNLVNTGKNPG